MNGKPLLASSHVLAAQFKSKGKQLGKIQKKKKKALTDLSPFFSLSLHISLLQGE